MWYLIEYKYKNFKIVFNEMIIVQFNYVVMVIGCVMGFYSNDFYMIVIFGINQYFDFYKIVVFDYYRESFICVIIFYEFFFNF